MDTAAKSAELAYAVARSACPAVDFCESPIEELFWAVLARFVHPVEQSAFRLKVWHESFLAGERLFVISDLDWPPVGERIPILWYAQTEVGGYRIDFDVRFLSKQRWHYIAVELDGHDYHERTKEQAQRDKSRDRDLVAGGWTVLRFTGAEVYRDASGCVEEVARVIRAMLNAGIETGGVEHTVGTLPSTRPL